MDIERAKVGNREGRSDQLTVHDDFDKTQKEFTEIMNLGLPKDTFKNVPPRVWAIIALGITFLLVMIGLTVYKFGGIFVNIEKGVEKSIEKVEK